MVEDRTSIPADYNDGVTAARRAVLLRLTADGLAIAGPDGDRPLAVWAYESLRYLDEALPGAPLRLATAGSDGRLTLRETTLPPALLARAPQLVRRQPRRSRTLALWTVGFFGAFVALALVIFAMPHVARLAVPLVPKSWEQALGRRLSDEVSELLALAYSEDPVFCQAPAGVAALDRLGQRLAREAQSPFDFNIRVLKLPVVNAVAWPGGEIIIFSQLLKDAKSPDEIAGVLAHEMTHVARRHTTARLIETLGLTAFFGVMLGDLGSGGLAAGGQAMTGSAYSRRAEAEADDGAAMILGASGINTQGLADFFGRLSPGADDGGQADSVAAAQKTLMTYFSSHPAGQDRARRFAALAKPLLPALSPTDWQALQDICSVTVPLDGN